MANTEDMQAVITQVAIQAATVTVKAMMEEALPAKPHTRSTAQTKTSQTN